MILRNLAILAFAEGSLYEAAQAAAQDMRLAKVRFELHRGGFDAAREWLTAHRSPDVLIVGDSVEAGLGPRLDALAEVVEPSCKVILAGAKDSIALYRELTAHGIADYLGGKVTAGDLVSSVLRLFSVQDRIPKGKVLAVTGAVGGAGASTVATIVADELSRRLGDTVLADLDLALGTAGLGLALEIRDSAGDALMNSGLDIAMLERMAVRDRGLRVLSTHGSLRSTIGFEADAVERMLHLARGLGKAVVLDLPKGWSETHLRLLSLADEVVVVSTPELAAVRNSRMFLDELAAKRAEAAPVKVVLNKAGLIRGKEYGERDFKEALGRPLTATIPWDPLPLAAAIMEGKSLADAGGKAVAAIRGFGATLFSKENVMKRAAPGPLKTLFARFA
jgi:pilus assembly protein CpaE